MRYRAVSKFPWKLLVWVAISRKEVSRAVIHYSRAKISGKTYRNECLRKVLFPCIETLHPDGDNLFWPDLATAHYARDTLELLDDRGVLYATRERNPPKVPQLCPMEDFLGIIKQEVYKG